MSDRSQIDLSKPFDRGNDLFEYTFTEATNRHQVRSDVLRAFIEGFNCFKFKFEHKGRKFEDRIALPHAAGFDERDAVEMAEYAHDRFLNTVAKIITK